MGRTASARDQEGTLPSYHRQDESLWRELGYFGREGLDFEGSKRIPQGQQPSGDYRGLYGRDCRREGIRAVRSGLPALDQELGLQRHPLGAGAPQR